MGYNEPSFIRRSKLENPSVLAALLSDISKVEVNVFKYKNLVIDGDWSNAFQTAINDVSDNGIVRIPYGIYNASGIVSEGKSINIIGNGATIVQNSNSTVFDLKGGFEYIQTVSSISNTTYDFSEGNNTTTPVSVITVQDGSVYKKGDEIKVYSDDEIENAFQPTTGTARKRKGEFALISLVNGNDLILSKRLRTTYSTNIKLAKIKDLSCTIKGLEFDVSDIGESSTPKWNAKMIKISSFKNVSLNQLSSKNGYEAFILLMSCLRYSANEIHAKNHRNEPSNNRYGYGINDTACDGGIISNSTFTNCRHGFTTATASIETNSQPELYGSTSNTTISNSKGRGCSNAAFDVHEEAFNVSFNNCESVGDYAGAVASGYGFQVRAQKIQLSNCTVQGSRGGFYIFMQYDGTTKDALLNNCKAFNVETSLQITAKDGLTMKDVIINGGFFESWGAVGNIFKNVEVLINGGATIVTSGYQGSTLLNSKVNIKDCYLESKSSNGAYRIMDLLQSSTLKLKNVELNVEESVATDGKLIRLSDSLSTVIGDNLDVITNGKTIFNVFDSSGSGIGKLKVTNVKADSDVLILTPTNFETVETSWLTLTKSSNAIFQDLASDGLSPNLGNAYDTTIYIRLKCLTANRVLGAIPVGKKLGQVLVIRNSASTFTLTVKHGTTYNTAIGADVTLPVDGAITLIWTGSQWVNTK